MKDNLILMISIVAIASLALIGAYIWIKTKRSKIPAYTVGNVNLKINEYTWDLVKNESTKSSGKKLNKDPIVTVDANSDQCFVFLKVDRPQDCERLVKITYDFQNWKLLDGTSNVYYTYVNEDEAEQGKELPALFQITNNEKEYQEYYQDFNENATLNISAYAIQTDGLIDVSDAWINVNVF